MTTAPRVLIAESDLSVRTGLKLLLGHAGFDVAAEAVTADDAVAAADDGLDAALIACDLPGGGIAAVQGIAARHALVPIVLLSDVPSGAELAAAVRAGAAGYIGKDIASDGLPRVMRAVLDGEVALPRRHTRELLDALRGEEARRTGVSRRMTARLSEREWEVLRLLAEEASTAEIAQRLKIAEVTVRRHVGSLLRKLGVCDRAGAVAIWRAG